MSLDKVRRKPEGRYGREKLVELDPLSIKYVCLVTDRL